MEGGTSLDRVVKKGRVGEVKEKKRDVIVSERYEDVNWMVTGRYQF